MYIIFNTRDNDYLYGSRHKYKLAFRNRHEVNNFIKEYLLCDSESTVEEFIIERDTYKKSRMMYYFYES